MVGKARDEMSPTNCFRLYAGHRSGEGETREYAARRKAATRTRPKILVQLVGAVMEVGNFLKCILVVLVFFGLAILAKIW